MVEVESGMMFEARDNGKSVGKLERILFLFVIVNAEYRGYLYFFGMISRIGKAIN